MVCFELYGPIGQWDFQRVLLVVLDGLLGCFRFCWQLRPLFWDNGGILEIVRSVAIECGFGRFIATK